MARRVLILTLCAALGPARALVNGPQRPVSRFSTRLRADELDEHAVELSRPDIDWDGELAAIMKGEQDHVARPRGKNYFVARNQLRARMLFRSSNKRIIETQRSAQQSIAELQDMPFRVLQHDWRFWVSVLGGFSLFAAALEGIAYSF